MCNENCLCLQYFVCANPLGCFIDDFGGGGRRERRGEEDRDRECYSKVVCENSVTVLLLM